MSNGARKLVFWLYIIATLVTFLGVVAITIFEVHVRWSFNQNFSVLDPNALAALIMLFAAQMLGLAWLSRPN
jgi:hypothetical protein